MAWPFSKKQSEQDKYIESVKWIATGFFKASLQIAINLRDEWNSLGLNFNLDNQQLYGLARETSWYWIWNMEHFLNFQQPAPIVDMTIRNLSNETLTMLLRPRGKEAIPNKAGMDFVEGSMVGALDAYRAAVSVPSDGKWRMPDEIEGSLLHTLTRRIEWVIKWDTSSKLDIGWKLSDELTLSHYEDYLALTSTTERNTDIDESMNNHPAWKLSVTNLIAGAATATRDVVSKSDLVRLSEFAGPIPYRLSPK